MMNRKPRRLVHGPRPDGARALDRYLRDNQLSVPAFCETHELDRLPVERLISGDAKRPDVGLLFRLEEITGGTVPAAAWARESIREDLPNEVPGAIRGEKRYVARKPVVDAADSGELPAVESTGTGDT